jgi:hypothetical protein
MIPKFINPLIWPLYVIIGRIFIIWASRLKPHHQALERFGIRVVAPKDYGSRDDHGEVYTALALLDRFDEEKLELVRKYLPIIFLVPMEIASGYVETGRLCYLSLKKFPESPAGTTPIVIASRLVYFAILAKIKKGFATSEDVRNICKEEERRTMQKLSEILCE